MASGVVHPALQLLTLCAPRSPRADWIFLTICLAIAGGIFWLAKGPAVQKSLDAQAQGLKVSAAAACAARR